jgi:tetratricopeptide (TPR) repeat protein
VVAPLARGLACALALLAAAGSARAGNVTDREIAAVRATYLVERGDFAGAEALLRAHLREDTEDASALARLAEVHFNLNRVTEALEQINSAFEELDSRLWSVAERVKWTSLKVQILSELNRIPEARELLRPLEAFKDYAEWISEVRSKLASGTVSRQDWPLPQPSQTNWSVQAQVSGGSDSNFGFVSDPIATSLEGDEDADLGSLYSDFGLAVARTSQNTQRIRQTRFGLGYRQYVLEGARYYNSLAPSVAFSHTGVPVDPFKDWVWQQGAQVQASLLNLDGMQLYLTAADLRPGIRRVSGADSGETYQLIFQYNVYGASYAGEGTENRSGLNAGVGTSLDRRLGNWMLSVGAQGLRLQPSGSSYQGYAWMAPLVANWMSPAGRWSAELASNPGQRIYSGGTEGRKDLWLDGRLSVHFGWKPTLRVGFEGGWLKNNSTLDDYDFTKTEGSLFIRTRL